MTPKQESWKRKEAILTSLKNFDYLTADQISHMHSLPSKRSALRIMQSLRDYTSWFYDGGKIYYLNQRGRDAVGARKTRTKLTTADHYLMRNNLYLYLNAPSTWRNEIKITSRGHAHTVVAVADAMFTSVSRKLFIIEVDVTQKMAKNRTKMNKYRRLMERGAFQDYQDDPEFIWVTTTEHRRKRLQDLSEVVS